jgi:tetratricopeptide (TPR) repeat protein
MSKMAHFPQTSPTNADFSSVFEQAQALALQRQYGPAQSLYLSLLKDHPENHEVLVNLGILAYESGHTSAAKTAYAEAVRVAPARGLAHLHWGHLLLHAGDLSGAQNHYESALAAEPDLAAAHQGLSVVLLELGHSAESEMVLKHRELGFGAQPWVTYPAAMQAQPHRIYKVLVLLAGRGGDVPWRPLLDPRHFEVTTLAVDFLDTALQAKNGQLPPHDLVFNAVGDADVSGASLLAAERVNALTAAPWVNSIQAVLATGRANNAQHLAQLPGVRSPQIREWSRTALLAASEAQTDLVFPLLLRRPGFQTGKYFAKLDSISELKTYLEKEPGDRWLTLAYLNARGVDGAYRKYRVMMIDGALYPLHLAISNHWKVHYFSAAMKDKAEHRAEEQRFLSDPQGVLGTAVWTALQAIQAELGLDYAGIDFGLKRHGEQGELLFFEANATMVMALPPADPMWDYRRAATERAMAAANALFLKKAQAPR